MSTYLQIDRFLVASLLAAIVFATIAGSSWRYHQESMHAQESRLLIRQIESLYTDTQSAGLLSRLSSVLQNSYSVDQFFSIVLEPKHGAAVTLFDASNRTSSAKSPTPLALELGDGIQHLFLKQELVHFSAPLRVGDGVFANILIKRHSTALRLEVIVALIVLLTLAGWVSNVRRFWREHNGGVVFPSPRLAPYRDQLMISDSYDSAAAAQSLSAEGRADPVIPFRSVLENLPFGILIVDKLGTAIFANLSFETIVGVAREQTIGRSITEWCAESQVLELMQTGGDNVTDLHNHACVTFTPTDKREARINVTRIKISDRVDRDIVEAEFALLFHDRTKAHNTQQSWGDFINASIHDLKSPLQVVALYADLLLDETTTATQRAQAAVMIQRQIEKSDSLLNDIFTLAHLQVGDTPPDFQDIDTLALTNSLIEAVGDLAIEKEVTLNVMSDDNLPSFFADESMIELALIHLVENAIKYNRPGGSVYVSIEDRCAEVSIKVSDTGIGIRDYDRAAIFKMFFRSDDQHVREQAGHGLGLALAQEVADVHGGRLTFQSQWDRGSMFRLTLPKLKLVTMRATAWIN